MRSMSWPGSRCPGRRWRSAPSRPGSGGHHDPRAAVGAGDGVGDEVADRGADLLLRAEELQAVLPAGLDGDLLGDGLHRARVDRGRHSCVEVHQHGGLERVVALETESSIDLLTSLARRSLSVSIRLANRWTASGSSEASVTASASSRMAPTGVLSSWLTLATKSRRTASTRFSRVRPRRGPAPGVGAQRRDARGEGAGEPAVVAGGSMSLSRIWPS